MARLLEFSLTGIKFFFRPKVLLKLDWEPARSLCLEARRGSGFCWLLKAGAEWKLALPLEF